MYLRRLKSHSLYLEPLFIKPLLNLMLKYLFSFLIHISLSLSEEVAYSGFDIIFFHLTSSVPFPPERISLFLLLFPEVLSTEAGFGVHSHYFEVQSPGWHTVQIFFSSGKYNN